MYRYIKAGKDNLILSALDLGDTYYGEVDYLEDYLSGLPIGTKITDIVNSPGSHWEGREVPVELHEAYVQNMFNPVSSPNDWKYKERYWTVAGSKYTDHGIAKIIVDGTRYYTTRDVFEDDNF